MPDEVRLMAALVTAPEAPFVPPEAQGKPVCVLAAAHCGAVDEGERVLAPLRDFGPPVVDAMRELSYVELQQTVDKTIPPGRRAYVKSDFLGGSTTRLWRSWPSTTRARRRRTARSCCTRWVAPSAECRPTRPRSPTATPSGC